MITQSHLPIWASHYPHAFWPNSHNGAGHIYGHTHSHREITLDLALPGRRSMDIGVDYAKKLLGDYRPFELDYIANLLVTTPGHDPVQFYWNLDNDKTSKRNTD